MENNLEKLSHQELIEGAKELVSQEIKTGLKLLEYLREIEAQMIYAELGFDSMWSFCVKYLKLSEGDAQRKLASMRLCKVIPEVKDDLTQGRITLTNAAQVQSFFNAEKRAGNDLSVEKKKEVLQSVHCLSKSECEKKLMELSPVSAIPAERLRPVTQDYTELKVVLDSETLKALDQLKNLLAHTLGDVSYQTLIQYLAADTLKRVKKAKGLESELVKELEKTEGTVKAPEQEPVPINKVQPSEGHLPPPPVATQVRREAIPAKIRRMVFQRAKGRCQYRNPAGRVCGSQHRLEINHKTPVAFGGKNDLFNLELTCRNHNVLHALHAMGQTWKPPLTGISLHKSL
jgi:hypothetical protein